jgi:hypothetical protein
MDNRLTSYAEFWPYYLSQHRQVATRVCHYVGTSLVIAFALAAAVSANWRYLLALPVAGYGPAWFGHWHFEHNQPATFKYPLWSLVSDFRMLGFFLLGRLEAERKRHGVE